MWPTLDDCGTSFQRHETEGSFPSSGFQSKKGHLRGDLKDKRDSLREGSSRQRECAKALRWEGGGEFEEQKGKCV